MTTLTIPALEGAVKKTNVWIEELAEDFDGDYHNGYQALRACLHALRDCLTVEEASDLAAQLPLIIRGLYYEGWNPAKVPCTDKSLSAFLGRIENEMGRAATVAPEQAARSVFKLLAVHCTIGQVNHVRSHLPKSLQSLWPL